MPKVTTDDLGKVSMYSLSGGAAAPLSKSGKLDKLSFSKTERYRISSNVKNASIKTGIALEFETQQKLIVEKDSKTGQVGAPPLSFVIFSLGILIYFLLFFSITLP